MKNNIHMGIAIAAFFALTVLSCDSLWKINHIPEGLLYHRYLRDMFDENNDPLLDTAVVPTETAAASQTQPTLSPAEDWKLDYHVVENRDNELVFDISLTDFIDSYNRFYYRDYNTLYLLKPSEWCHLVYDSSVHSDYETALYEFSSEPEIWSQPTITVYVPTNKESIQEITLNFDEHGYSETFYDAFEELCYYTLKVFFPELPNQQIVDLYKKLNMLGNQNVFDREHGYGKGCVPCVLYYQNGVGVYPYFAVGEWQHLCIIPVTEESLQDFTEKGVEIHEIT